MKWLQSHHSLLRACRWAIKGEQALAGKTSPLSERAYAKLAKADLLGLTLFPAITAKELGSSGSLRDEFRFLRQAGHVPAGRQWDDVRECFDTGIVEELVHERRKYRLDDFQYAEGGATDGADD